MKISSERFGVGPTGEEVQIFILSNNQGVEVSIINYGGIIVGINVPDRNGKIGDVVLGHNSLEGYLKRSRYFGALAGRYANRIARGRFRLNDVEFKLATNNGPNHLVPRPQNAPTNVERTILACSLAMVETAAM